MLLYIFTLYQNLSLIEQYHLKVGEGKCEKKTLTMASMDSYVDHSPYLAKKNVIGMERGGGGGWRG